MDGGEEVEESFDCGDTEDIKNDSKGCGGRED